MSDGRPEISIIIPTHNRRDSLKRMLDGLRAQTFGPDKIEVIVVVDGSTDDTVAMLKSYPAPFGLQVLTQANQGPSVARNLGATAARGRWLLFLDDDIDPTPSLIEAHVRVHQEGPGRVVLGPYPPVSEGRGLLEFEMRLWWEAHFKELCRPGHRFTYRDLLTGNLSIEAGQFKTLGGFETSMRVHEDYEFGMRLIKAGVAFAVAPEAVGWHHETRNIRRSLTRRYDEGEADVVMARRHPEFARTLQLVSLDMKSLRRLTIPQLLVFVPVFPGWVVMAFLRRLLNAFERMKLRYAWRRLYQALNSYWYWRGARDAAGSLQGVRDLAKAGHNPGGPGGPIIEIDLGEGIEAAERRLDRERPTCVMVRYRKQRVGVIPVQPAAEPLRGVHLRPILTGSLALPLLEAMAEEGELPSSPSVDRPRLVDSIRMQSAWFGPWNPDQMWLEQYAQWKRFETGESEKDRAVREHWDRFRAVVKDIQWFEAERDRWRRMAEAPERSPGDGRIAAG